MVMQLIYSFLSVCTSILANEFGLVHMYKGIHVLSIKSKHACIIWYTMFGSFPDQNQWASVIPIPIRLCLTRRSADYLWRCHTKVIGTAAHLKSFDQNRGNWAAWCDKQIAWLRMATLFRTWCAWPYSRFSITIMKVLANVWLQQIIAYSLEMPVIYLTIPSNIQKAERFPCNISGLVQRLRSWNNPLTNMHVRLAATVLQLAILYYISWVPQRICQEWRKRWHRHMWQC